jgi:hypothetical protein
MGMMQFDLTRKNTSGSPSWSRSGPYGCGKPFLRQAPSSFSIPLHRGCLDHIVRHHIEEELRFLEPLARSIHSLVVVGSAAYGIQGPDSDIDLVIIATARDHGKVCDVLFAGEIEAALAGGKAEFEFTVLSAADAENLFKTSSPFAYSIRYGTVLRDDGYLGMLRSRKYPRRPTPEYARTCLFEKIMTPYYTALREFHVERKKRNSGGNCLNVPGERGSSLEQLLARVIMHMLYVTLPSRGMMPLTKSDVVAYARKAYGLDAEKVVGRAVALVRGNPPGFVEEWIRLKQFAVQLFKEVLRLVGVDHHVRTMIADASKIAGISYDSVRNGAMRTCVL